MHRHDAREDAAVVGRNPSARAGSATTAPARAPVGPGRGGDVHAHARLTTSADVMRLQRLAGNGATSAVLGARDATTVQRQIAYTPEMLKKSGGKAHLFRSSDYKAVTRALVAYHREPASPKAPALLAALISACDKWLAGKARSASGEKDLAIVAIRAQATTELGRLQQASAPPAAANPMPTIGMGPSRPADYGTLPPLMGPGRDRPSDYGTLPPLASPVGPAVRPPAAATSSYNSPGVPAAASSFYNSPGVPAAAPSLYHNSSGAAPSGYGTLPPAGAVGPSSAAARGAPAFGVHGPPAFAPPAQAPFDPNRYRVDPDSLEPEAIMSSFRGAFADFDETEMTHGGEDWEAFHATPDPAGGPKLTPQHWKGGRGNIRGLTPGDRPDFELTAGSDHVFYWGRDNKAYDTRQMTSLLNSATFGRAIFVMTRDGRIYAANMTAEYDLGNVPADVRDKWTFHHSSFLGGQPVASAGEIQIEDGRLVSVSDASGHYRPDAKYTVQVLQRLRSSGVDISTVSVEVTRLANAAVAQLPMVPATTFCDFQGDAEALLEFIGKGGRGAAEQEGEKASRRGGEGGTFESAFWSEAALAVSVGPDSAAYLTAALKYARAGTSRDAARMILKALAVAPDEAAVRALLAKPLPSGATVIAEYGRQLRALKASSHGTVDYLTAKVRALWDIVDRLAPS